jgi:hypothetical protein
MPFSSDRQEGEAIAPRPPKNSSPPQTFTPKLDSARFAANDKDAAASGPDSYASRLGIYESKTSIILQPFSFQRN